MNIGLINIDSKIPNIALMKLSAHHKARGDCVEWWKGTLFHKQYDKVYASKVFDFSKLPYDLPENIHRQMDYYRSQCYPKNNGLYELPTFIRKNTDKIKVLNLRW